VHLKPLMLPISFVGLYRLIALQHLILCSLTNGFNAEILDMKEMMDYIVKDVNDLPKWFHRIPLMKAQVRLMFVCLNGLSVTSQPAM